MVAAIAVTAMVLAIVSIYLNYLAIKRQRQWDRLINQAIDRLLKDGEYVIEIAKEKDDGK